LEKKITPNKEAGKERKKREAQVQKEDRKRVKKER